MIRVLDLKLCKSGPIPNVSSAEDLLISRGAALVLHKRKASRLIVHLVDGHIDVCQWAILLKYASQLPHILVPLHRQALACDESWPDTKAWSA